MKRLLALGLLALLAVPQVGQAAAGDDVNRVLNPRFRQGLDYWGAYGGGKARLRSTPGPRPVCRICPHPPDDRAWRNDH